MKKHTLFPQLWEWMIGFSVSFSWAGIREMIWQETVHGLLSVLTGVVIATVVHYWKYFLNWISPIKNKEK